jgi:protein O-GlcNAc transferase
MAIALTDLGTRVKLEGKMAEAIALYERALVYNSKYPDAMYNLGVAYGEMGQVRVSSQHYTRDVTRVCTYPYKFFPLCHLL